jgi:hypothetical protein
MRTQIRRWQIPADDDFINYNWIRRIALNDVTTIHEHLANARDRHVEVVPRQALRD